MITFLPLIAQKFFIEENSSGGYTMSGNDVNNMFNFILNEMGDINNGITYSNIINYSQDWFPMIGLNDVSQKIDIHNSLPYGSITGPITWFGSPTISNGITTINDSTPTGISQWGVISDTPYFPHGTDSCSIGIWFRFTQNPLVPNISDGFESEYVLEITGVGNNGSVGNRLGLYLRVLGNEPTATYSLGFEVVLTRGTFEWEYDNNWHFIVGTIPANSNSGDIKIYLDGVLQTLSYGFDPGGFNNCPMFLGTGEWKLGGIPTFNSGYNFSGQLKYPMLYKRELSSSEISYLYNDTKIGNTHSLIYHGSPTFSEGYTILEQYKYIDTGLILNNTDITLNFWVNTATTSNSASQRFFDYDDSTKGRDGIGVFNEIIDGNNGQSFIMRNNNQVFDIPWHLNYNLNTWYMYTAVISSQEGCSLYVNGLLTNSNQYGLSYSSLSNNQIYSSSLHNSGMGYNLYDTFIIGSGSAVGQITALSGDGFSFNIASLSGSSLTSITINSAGTGFTYSEIIKDMFFGQAVFEVLTVNSSGSILTYNIIDGGTGYSGPGTFGAEPYKNGPVSSYSLLSNGSDYVTASNVATTGLSGSGLTIDILTIVSPSLKFGTDGLGNTDVYFNGKIGGFQYFTYPLLGEDVYNLYNSQKIKFPEISYYDGPIYLTGSSIYNINGLLSMTISSPPSYGYVPYDSSFMPSGTQACSIGCFFKMSSITQPAGCIISIGDYGNGTPGQYIGISTDGPSSNLIAIDMDFDGVFATFSFDTSWHFAMITIPSNSTIFDAKLYFDGYEQNLFEYSGYTSYILNMSTNPQWKLGGITGRVDSFANFEGQIKYPMMYNRVLTSDEILNIWNTLNNI